MDAKTHAWLARQLIAACGGPRKSAEIIGRLQKSRVAQFQDPHSGAIMRVDDMFALEVFCGEPIYTRALMAARALEDGEVGESLADQACDLTQATAALQSLARSIEKGSTAGPASADRRQLLKDVSDVGRHLAAIRAMIAGGDL